MRAPADARWESRRPEQQRAEYCADEGAHQYRPQGPAGLAVSRHRVAIDDRRCRGRLPRDAEQNRGDVAGCCVTAGHAEEKGKRLDGFILNTKGSMRAMVVGPPRPGRMPTANPIANADHHQTECRPVKTLNQS